MRSGPDAARVVLTPALSEETIELIQRMARENERWAAEPEMLVNMAAVGQPIG